MACKARRSFEAKPVNCDVMTGVQEGVANIGLLRGRPCLIVTLLEEVAQQQCVVVLRITRPIQESERSAPAHLTKQLQD